MSKKRRAPGYRNKRKRRNRAEKGKMDAGYRFNREAQAAYMKELIEKSKEG